jgi:5-methylcytosine-specific restriction endonuclease McrA
MNILSLRTDPRFAFCPNAYVVTGKTKDLETDALNRKFLRRNKTGYWKIAPGRIKLGDAIFLLLPNQSRADGYPRELYGGVVIKVTAHAPDRTVVSLHEFFRLPPIEQEVKGFLLGNVPPQGNTALHLWEPLPLEEESNIFTDQVRASQRGDRESRLRRIEAAKRIPAQVTITGKAFVRNPDVVAEILDQANGVCGDCGSEGPFISKSDGRPFLEVHHVKRLTDGGEDTVENAIALCPNCHRKRHYERVTPRSG